MASSHCQYNEMQLANPNEYYSDLLSFATSNFAGAIIWINGKNGTKCTTLRAVNGTVANVNEICYAVYTSICELNSE